MDFELSEEQRAFARTAREFARAEFAPHAAQWDAEGIFPKEAIAKAGELGFWGLHAPESIEGLALPRLDATLRWRRWRRSIRRPPPSSPSTTWRPGNVCNEALQLHGGCGSPSEFPLERLVRDTRVHQIREGTDEIMRVIVSRKLPEGESDIR